MITARKSLSKKKLPAMTVSGKYMVDTKPEESRKLYMMEHHPLRLSTLKIARIADPILSKFTIPYSISS